MSSAEDSAFNTANSAVPDPAISSAPPASSLRSPMFTALLIFLLALAVRVAFFSIQVMRNPQLWSHTAPFFNDELSQIAINLAQGRGFSSPFSNGSAPTAWLCPLVPLLWAFVIRCVGSATGRTAMILIYISTLPSAACVAVYWLIARRILRDRQAAARTALIVAAVFCVWPESLYILDFPWYFPWQELAVAVMVLLGLRWIDRPGLKTAVPLGISAGILALINVTPVPVFAVLLLLPLFQHRTARQRIFGAAAVSVVLSVLVISPWIVRNALVLHAFVPMRGNGGFSLWEGNNPIGCIIETRDSVHPHNQQEELRRYQALGEVNYDREGSRRALAYMRAHPRVTLVRIAQRAYVIWLTDVTDKWSWDGRPYWQKGMVAIDKTMASTLAAWGLLILMLWALATKRLAGLPYKGVFISLVFFLPLPFYFTLAENDYVAYLRSWLLLLVILAMSGALQTRAGAKAES
jgi:hypothetical protein